jgi:hypothetical protein
MLHKSWPKHVKAVVPLIHIGMRTGQEFQLKWRDVCFEQRMISLA